MTGLAEWNKAMPLFHNKEIANALQIGSVELQTDSHWCFHEATDLWR
jgi:hypothetical protein